MSEHMSREGMLCPACRVDLVMSERQGIEIDYCPKCRGVWLDRGELDKIIERAAIPTQPQPAPQNASMVQPPPQSAWSAPRYDDDRQPKRYDKHGRGDQGHKKKSSWIAELFE